MVCVCKYNHLLIEVIRETQKSADAVLCQNVGVREQECDHLLNTGVRDAGRSWKHGSAHNQIQILVIVDQSRQDDTICDTLERAVDIEDRLPYRTSDCVKLKIDAIICTCTLVDNSWCNRNASDVKAIVLWGLAFSSCGGWGGKRKNVFSAIAQQRVRRQRLKHESHYQHTIKTLRHTL